MLGDVNDDTVIALGTQIGLDFLGCRDNAFGVFVPFTATGIQDKSISIVQEA